MDLAGSVTVITGASRGIGAATARAAAAVGARVGLVARSKDELEQVLSSCGGNGVAVAADVGDQAAVTEAIGSIERELGPVDVLINNAGIGLYGPVVEMDPEDFDRVMRVNYLGCVWALKAVLPGMLERRRGHVVTVASIAGRLGAPLEAGYSASKFAVVGLSEALAIELAGKGVGVSIIDPGPVTSSFFEARGAPFKRSKPTPVSPEHVADAIVDAIRRERSEVFIPRWLRFAWLTRVLLPGAYRRGTLREFRDDLR